MIDAALQLGPKKSFSLTQSVNVSYVQFVVQLSNAL